MSSLSEPPKVGPELFFAIIAPIGTPKQEFIDALESSLNGVGYVAVPIKLSKMLGERMPDEISSDHEERRVGALMDLGNDLCQQAKNGAAVALLSVSEIRAHRAAQQAPADTLAEDLSHSGGRQLTRTAYVIDSLKRPAEVACLRALWGDNLIVVSLKADPSERRKHLIETLSKQSVTNKKSIPTVVDDLMGRDMREQGLDFGQNVVKTVPLADWFVDVDGNVAGDVQRFVHTLFGDPKSAPATSREFAMQAATQAAMLTPELGNRVGAVVLDRFGTVVASGANMHPLDAETPKYDESHFSIRELVADTMIKLRDVGYLSEAATANAADDQIDVFAAQLLLEVLKDAKIQDLVEFQLPVHAEMNALLGALRRGVSLSGCSIFVTAHPCHLCAKHLIPLELEVVYLEPYPKGRAGAMYGDAALEHFRPFTGVAPRRFESLFRMSQDRKNPDGKLKSWDRRASMPKVDPFVAAGVNDREVEALGAINLLDRSQRHES